MTSEWQRLVFVVPGSDAAAVEEMLEALGAAAVTTRAAAAEPALFGEPGEIAGARWSRCELEALVPAAIDQASFLAALAAAHPEARLRGSGILADRAWADAWRAHAHPIDCGHGLWICPTWRDPPAGARVVVRLDPGLAFGTGSHPTTALCLEWLARHDFHGEWVLDYGCGSGILAVAALRLGAAAVTAVDVDPQALEAAAANAVRNDAAAVAFGGPELPRAGAYDLIVANILLAPLLRLAPEFARLLRPRGHLVLSGVLQEQVPELVQHYQDFEPGRFRLLGSHDRDDWAVVEFSGADAPPC